jgi:putative hydrolase of HD superfamily
MLGMLACALRDACAPELDRGKLAQYALVHDFVEVYAGDTVTLGMIDKREKEEKEQAALERIKKEYDEVFPWIGEMIERYESQEDPEARFIKVLDKVLPGLTHMHNLGTVLEELNVSPVDIKEQKKVQRAWVVETAQEWPLLIDIYDRVHEDVFNLPYFKNTKEREK